MERGVLLLITSCYWAIAVLESAQTPLQHFVDDADADVDDGVGPVTLKLVETAVAGAVVGLERSREAAYLD